MTHLFIMKKKENFHLNEILIDLSGHLLTSLFTFEGFTQLEEFYFEKNKIKKGFVLLEINK